MAKEKEKIEVIKKRYKDEWVLIADYELDEGLNPLCGVVIAHSKNRDEIYKEQMYYKGNLCIEYTGEIPDNLAVML
ncbi:hypothetical protein KKC52_12055 [bacterium]|nr:hypothetical protein [bacterium]